MERQVDRLAARRGSGSDRGEGELGPSLAGAEEALALARWDELPDAELPWDRVSEMAAAQDISEADVVWDLAVGLPPRTRRRRAA